MAVVVMPDAERLVIDALIADADVAALVAGRVYGVIPNVKVLPLVRVVRIGGQMLDDGNPYWADAPALQIDCWADRKAEAVELGEVVRAVCATRLAGAYPTGVIAGVGIGAKTYDPDTSFTPAKPRVRLSLDMVTRPPTAPAPPAAAVALSGAGAARRPPERQEPR
jgi:hypothetical protein